MFWAFIFAILASAALPLSQRVEEQTTVVAQNDLLAEQLIILIALIKEYASNTPFKSESVIELSRLDPQGLTARSWLEQQLAIYRTESGFFIHILSPQKQWASTFLRKTSIQYSKDPQSKYSDVAESPLKLGRLILYPIGIKSNSGLEFDPQIAASFSDAFSLSVPTAPPIGSTLIWLR